MATRDPTLDRRAHLLGSQSQKVTSVTFAQGMMLAELNASRARVQSEREGQARILGFMGVPMGM